MCVCVWGGGRSVVFKQQGGVVVVVGEIEERCVCVCVCVGGVGLSCSSSREGWWW